MKPIVFLDIDGVLNSHRFYVEAREKGLVLGTGENDICPEAVKNLNRLLRESDSDVVVSSTWRLFHKDMRPVLYRNGVDIDGRYLGNTPDCSAQRPSGVFTSIERGHEIQAWLNQNGATDRPFVILDDDADMAHLKPYLVQTNGRDGLTSDDVERALQMLSQHPVLAA